MPEVHGSPPSSHHGSVLDHYNDLFSTPPSFPHWSPRHAVHILSVTLQKHCCGGLQHGSSCFVSHSELRKAKQHIDHVWEPSWHHLGPQGDKGPKALWCWCTGDAEHIGHKQGRCKSVIDTWLRGHEWAPNPIQQRLGRILCCAHQVWSIHTLSLYILSGNFVCQSIFYFPSLSHALCCPMQCWNNFNYYSSIQR